MPAENSALPAKWSMLGNITLYEWQRAALDAWRSANNRGIIKVVTAREKRF
jgi:hypothetical protein